jgi:hypothetical protein
MSSFAAQQAVNSQGNLVFSNNLKPFSGISGFVKNNWSRSTAHAAHWDVRCRIWTMGTESSE